MVCDSMNATYTSLNYTKSVYDTELSRVCEAEIINTSKIKHTSISPFGTYIAHGHAVFNIAP